jgi:membrane-bound lytic murein transglycosylase MltF
MTRLQTSLLLSFLLAILLAATGCGGAAEESAVATPESEAGDAAGAGESAAGGAPAEGAAGGAPAEGAAGSSPGDALPEQAAGDPEPLAFPEEFDQLLAPWTGDWDQMVERCAIRVLVVYNKMLYFLDEGTQRGLTADLLREFENDINRKLKRRTLKVRVYPIPVKRDQLIPALAEGRGDIAAANLTVTPERLEAVDFSNPLAREIREIVVTGTGAPPLTSLEDLAGQELYVRASSSYHESLLRLSDDLAKKGLQPVKLRAADENLEDGDILEMVNAGLVSMTVVDSHKAHFWAPVYEKITLHEALAVRSGGDVAWALRKNTPKLQEMVNAFVRGHKKGTKVGNILLQRYLKDSKWVKSAAATDEVQKFQEVADHFRKYAGEYDFPWLMIVAQAYQESGLDQRKKSRAGAVGIMQVLPATARDPKVDIADIQKLENNIHAGVKYMHVIAEQYLDDEDLDPLNRMLLAFASYNAGPSRIRQMRRKAAKMGLDPNVWFQNVEVAVARNISREPVQYVSNIYKYYLAYEMIVERSAAREATKEAMQGG